MQLLVSVATEADADEAVAGGAHIIDAKDPAAGPLGAVTPDVLRAIRARVPASIPLSAALGDAVDEAGIERLAHAYALVGLTFVKVGFAGVTDARRIGRLLDAALRGVDAAAGPCSVVAVAYADAAEAGCLPAHDILRIAAQSTSMGVLLDTAGKRGPGLCTLLPRRVIAAWVADAHRAGLRVGLAGKLTAADLPFVRETRAGIAGVRGAACDGGRHGRVASAKVRTLVELVGGDGHDGGPGPDGALEIGIDEVAG